MATLSIRIDDNLKKETERNLKSMGLTFSSAINIYFAKINQTHKIPFEVEACPYDPEFVRMMEESLAGFDPNSTRYTSGEEALRDILGEDYAL
jgi:DNA-damage-inducible protein J